MNVHLSFSTAADMAKLGVPWGYFADPHNDGCWTQFSNDGDVKTDSIERLDREFRGALARCEVAASVRSTLKGRTDSARAVDAAEVFYTNNLEVVLPTIMRLPKTSGVMTGPDAMLPIRSTLRPGQLAGVYDIESTTGQASWVEPDGARKLQQVSEFSERHKYTSGFVGVGYGIGLVEMWQAAERGQPLEQMRRMTAEAALQRFVERTRLYGDAGHEVLGVLANSHAYYQALASNFTAQVASPDTAQIYLQTMETFFKIIGESYSVDAPITGVIAPKRDLQALQRMRWTDGQAALPDFYEMHPWLRPAEQGGAMKWVEHIQASGPGGGNQWIFWSDDASELWAEGSPTPMLFGPWQDSNTGLRQSWGILQQEGGVIMRRRERMVRFEFAA
jgi:hypothetical protein